MNQQSFIKILGLTLLVVAATVGIAFIVAPSPIDGGRFCLALLPVVFAELLLGAVILMSGTDDPKSARLLFGLSRAWTVTLYLGFTIFAALLVALGAHGGVLAILHIIAGVLIIGWNVLGSTLAAQADQTENVHPVDSSLSRFKDGLARLNSRLQLNSAPELAAARAALAKTTDELRYVYLESAPASAEDDAEIGTLLQAIQSALAEVETAGPAAGQGIAAQAAQLSVVIKRRSATLARRL
jgi:hypothetical protein